MDVAKCAKGSRQWPKSIMGMCSHQGTWHQIQLREDRCSEALSFTPLKALREMIVEIESCFLARWKTHSIVSFS